MTLSAQTSVVTICREGIPGPGFRLGEPVLPDVMRMTSQPSQEQVDIVSADMLLPELTSCAGCFHTSH